MYSRHQPTGHSSLHEWKRTSLQKLLPLLLLLTLLVSCRSPVVEEWTDLVPQRTPFLILPESGSSLTELLEAPFMPIFEEMTPSAIQLTRELLIPGSGQVDVAAILLYPDTSTEWQPVWIVRSIPGLLPDLAGRFQRPFEQNRYRFREWVIEKLFVSDRTLFMVDTGNWTVVSESSMAIEDMLRTRLGELPPLHLTESQRKPGSFLANTPSLDEWVEQLVQISFRPSVEGSFRGGTPLSLTFSGETVGEKELWSLSGSMWVDRELSPLIRSVSAPSRPVELDRYISINAAGFSIFRLEPRKIPPAGVAATSEIDRYLMENDLYPSFASTLGSETAFAAFAESGFSTSGEYLFLRKLEDVSGFRNLLNRLSSANLIRQEGNSFYMNSSLLGNLLGSDLSSISAFYLSVVGEAVALSNSRSLVESTYSDFSRRRVLYYDEHYTEIRQNLPTSVSSFTWMDVEEFHRFIGPWLAPQNNLDALAPNLEVLTLVTSRESGNAPLDVRITSHSREMVDAPYQERWLFPIRSDLTGRPVLADITGSPREELLFSTREGSVYVLAGDGSLVVQMSTAPDRPVGPPVAYDWYGNNRNVIMQAAGDKIYAWNEAGTLLPSFPVRLGESITTPLHVEDVTRDGVAEMIVATADRRIHILNARGENIAGWPRTANSMVTSLPLITDMGGERSLFAFAENGLHGWNINGSRRDGFPLFIDARYNGSPVLFENHILGAASDGNLYATGPTGLFADSLMAHTSGDSLVTRSLNVSNSSLNRSPVVTRQMVRAGGNLVRENLIVTQSSNGAVQVFNTAGQLRFSQNMGQPASDLVSPEVLDIDRDNRIDLLALASFGRLFGWDLISGERLYELPASGMNYPLFADLNRDGTMEIIAQTREGLRAWSIFRGRSAAALTSAP